MLIAVFVAAVLTIIFIKYLWSAEEDPVDKLPGPRWLPIIGSATTVLIPPRKLFEKLQQLRKEYGDRYIIKALDKKVVDISNPGDIETVLSNTKNLKKSLPYDFLESWLGTGLLLSTGSKWHKRRKILTPTFHFNILKNFATVMEEKSRDLIERLKGFNGKEVDVLPVISDFTLYTICETAMGTQLDSDKSAAAVEYKQAIVDIADTLLERVTRFWLHNEFIFKLIAGKQHEKTLKIVHSFADNVILDKKKIRDDNKNTTDKLDKEEEDVGSKKRLAMLDLLLDAESKGEIDVEGIREEVNTFMFEGHDTTAMGLTFCLMLIAQYDEVQERVYNECRKIQGEVKRPFSLSDLTEMKYLEAVIKETLRLYPSVPIIGREITEDFIMRDVLVKKGTYITMNLYDLHHREDLFPNAEEFRPERFLNNEITNPYAFIPFSAGPRNCIGQRFAMQEMKFALSEICTNFRLVPLEKGIKPTLMTDMVLRPVNPVLIKFVPR